MLDDLLIDQEEKGEKVIQRGNFENACYTGVQGGVWLQSEAEASAKYMITF